MTTPDFQCNGSSTRCYLGYPLAHARSPKRDAIPLWPREPQRGNNDAEGLQMKYGLKMLRSFGGGNIKAGTHATQPANNGRRRAGPDQGRCSRLNAILFGHGPRTAFTQSPPQSVVQLPLPCQGTPYILCRASRST